MGLGCYFFKYNCSLKFFLSLFFFAVIVINDLNYYYHYFGVCFYIVDLLFLFMKSRNILFFILLCA